MRVEMELALLENATLEELRSIWERRYGAPPRLRSPALLRQILAWRLQAHVEGGLDARTRKLLRREAAGQEALLPAGTVIAREWRGERHEVEVGEDGYIYSGKCWSSLSEVARAITGTRWNGPRFFGLRQAA